MADSESTTNRRLSPTTPMAVLIVGLSVIPFALFLFSQMGRYLFLAELVGNFRAQILVMLVPFPILLIAVGRWRWAVVMAFATAWAMVGVLFIYLPGYQPKTDGPTIKIMSFNVLGDNYEGEQFIQRVREEDPDIVLVVEYANHWVETCQELNDTYPHRVLEPRWHGFGIGLFSKYPLEETVIRPLTKNKTDVPTIVTHVRFNQQSLRLVGLHVLSPTSLFRMRLRNKQLAEMADFLVKSDEPTVVMGDFNCTPWSPFLSDFLDVTGYRDSRQGFGYQPSWHANLWPLMIPIDHALISDRVRIHNRYLAKKAGSDHLPLVFEVSVGK